MAAVPFRVSCRFDFETPLDDDGVRTVEAALRFYMEAAAYDLNAELEHGSGSLAVDGGSVVWSAMARFMRDPSLTASGAMKVRPSPRVVGGGADEMDVDAAAVSAVLASGQSVTG